MYGGSICVHLPTGPSLGSVSDKDPPTAFPRMESAPVTPCKGHPSKRQSRPCLVEKWESKWLKLRFFHGSFLGDPKKIPIGRGSSKNFGNSNWNVHLPPQNWHILHGIFWCSLHFGWIPSSGCCMYAIYSVI